MNGRGLDVRVRTPPGFDAIGEEARKAASAAVTRGTVNVALTLQRSEQARPAPRINRDALDALWQDASEIAEARGVAAPSFEALLQTRGVVEVAEGDHQPSEATLKALAAGAQRAAKALAVARAEEGRALRVVLLGQVNRIGELVAEIAAHPARAPEAIRIRLEEQVRTLLGAAPQLDQARLHQEAALLATRADVREEIDRLLAHVDAARKLLNEGGAVGRKLDFLSQEFAREASTLCAKANHVELSRFGLELRTVVDQLREQAQNVE